MLWPLAVVFVAYVLTILNATLDWEVALARQAFVLVMIYAFVAAFGPPVGTVVMDGLSILAEALQGL